MIIPSKDHVEWHELLSGKLNVQLKNFFFQMKITQVKNQIQKGTISIETAIDDLYALCTKFSKAKNMAEDIKSIFGDDYLEKPVVKIEEQNADAPIQEDLQAKDLMTLFKLEKEVEFYKKSVDQKEKEIQEKNKLIITLQEDNIYLRKKNTALYEVVQKIDEIESQVEGQAEKQAEKQEKESWSFFNIFKSNK